MRSWIRTLIRLSLLLLILLGSLYYLFSYLHREMPGLLVRTRLEPPTTVRVGVLDYVGGIGGIYANGGLEADSSLLSLSLKDFKITESELPLFFSQGGLLIDFQIYSHPDSLVKGWQRGDFDVAHMMLDEFVARFDSLKALNPQVIGQTAWSRGYEAIIVNKEINSLQELVGKKVAQEEKTSCHNLLGTLLTINMIPYNEVLTYGMPAKEALDFFFEGYADGVVLRGNMIDECIRRTAGRSKILHSTKDISQLNTSILVSSASYIQEQPRVIRFLLKGWLTANAVIKTQEEERNKAIKLFASIHDQPQKVFQQLFDMVQLCTIGDNQSFFGKTIAPYEITGQTLYNDAALLYSFIDSVKKEGASARVFNYIVDEQYRKIYNLKNFRLFDPYRGKNLLKQEASTRLSKNVFFELQDTSFRDTALVAQTGQWYRLRHNQVSELKTEAVPDTANPMITNNMVIGYTPMVGRIDSIVDVKIKFDSVYGFMVAFKKLMVEEKILTPESLGLNTAGSWFGSSYREAALSLPITDLTQSREVTQHTGPDFYELEGYASITPVYKYTLYMSFEGDNSFLPTEKAKQSLKEEFVPIINHFKNCKIYIQGKSYNFEGGELDDFVAFQRVNSVVKYLVSDFQFQLNRFVIANRNHKIKVEEDEKLKYLDGKEINQRIDFFLFLES